MTTTPETDRGAYRGQTGLTIGDLVARSGASASAIRFYERKGLMAAHRNMGNQRRYARADLRRLSFILIAQELGFSLADIKAQLDALPAGRTPNKADWGQISRQFSAQLDDRIAALTRLRKRLDSCIGCGCLSLDDCDLYNKADRAARRGTGAQYVYGDSD